MVEEIKPEEKKEEEKPTLFDLLLEMWREKEKDKKSRLVEAAE